MLKAVRDELQRFAMTASRRLAAIVANLGASMAAPCCLAGAIATADDEGARAIVQPAVAATQPAAPLVSTGQQSIDLLLQMSNAESPNHPSPPPKASRGGHSGDNAEAAALTPPGPAGAAVEKVGWDPSENLKQDLQPVGMQSWRGGGAADPAREDRRRVIEQDRGSRGAWDAPAAPQRGSSLLDLPVVRYIRENRTLVLAGAGAVLALVWGTATFSFHRRRRDGGLAAATPLRPRGVPASSRRRRTR